MNLANLLLPPVFGFFIGLGTNALAIRMLFRPHREVRILGLRFQGILPRRKADIARTVSRTVASELLREERVAERIAGREVRQALRALAVELSRRYLGGTRGSLEEHLGPDRARAVERFLERLLGDVAGLVGSWATTEEGTAFLRGIGDRVLRRTPAQLLRGEEHTARRWLLAKTGALVRDPNLERRLRRALDLGLVRLAATDLPLSELLPPELQRGLLQVLRGTVPGLLARFEEALLSPGNVARIKRAVRGGIEDYLTETEGGLVKNLVRQAALAGQDRINREADQIVDANLHRLRALIHEESNRAQVEQGLVDALQSLLRKTPAQLIASVPSQQVESTAQELVAWLAVRLRTPQAEREISRLMERELTVLFDTPLRDLLAASEADTDFWLAAFTQWLSAGALENLARGEAPYLARAVLRTPLDAAGRVLTPGLVSEVAELALDHLMPVLAGQVPELLRIINVEEMVQREILSFSAQEVERVVLAVARRELQAITWWGGGLGLAVGSLQSALFLLG